MARRGMDTTVAMKKAKVYRGTAARPSRAPTITKSKFLATVRAPLFHKANMPYSKKGRASFRSSGWPSLAPEPQASPSISTTAAA